MLTGNCSHTQFARSAMAGAPVPAPKCEPIAIEQVRGALSASTELTERVQRVVDRVAGGPSLSGREGCGSPSGSNGIIPDLVDQAEAAKSSIRDAHEALTRMEALFGL